jgi:hypothetical protein
MPGFQITRFIIMALYQFQGDLKQRGGFFMGATLILRISHVEKHNTFFRWMVADSTYSHFAPATFF